MGIQESFLCWKTAQDFTFSASSGKGSQNWGYCGKDAASSCSPSIPSPWMEDFNYFPGKHPLSSGSCCAPGLIWSHRLPRDDGLQFCLKENLHPALTPTQREGAQLKHRLCSNVLFVVVHLLKGPFEVALPVSFACSCPFRSTLGSVLLPTVQVSASSSAFAVDPRHCRRTSLRKEAWPSLGC